MKLLVVTLLVLAGCANISMLEKKSRSQEVVGDSASLFFVANLKLANNVQLGKCELIFNSDTHGKYSLALKPGLHSYIIKLPTGKYGLSKLSCDLMNSFSLGDLLPVFVAQKNRYAYIGKLSFHIVKRSELIMGVDRKSSLADSALLAKLPEDAQWNLYSPYTMKSIDPEMFKLTPAKRRNIFVGISPQDKTLIEIPSIKLCNREEIRFNPLRLGTLEYELVFAKESLPKVHLKKSHSAYSDRYIQCVKETLQHATSMLGQDVRVQIKL